MNDGRYPKNSTAWRSTQDKVKKKTPPKKKPLDRQHKGRLWNFGYDNNTSIKDCSG